MIGAKPYEFRGRSYPAYINHPLPRERISIHAGARYVQIHRDHSRESSRIAGE